jgi:hypothetical protein
VARKQQGPSFVAGLAKKPLSEKYAFGIMRVASQKNSGEVPKSRAAKCPRVSKKALK